MAFEPCKRSFPGKPEEWEAHRIGVVEDLKPEGAVELALAEQLAVKLWRLGRVVRHEADVTAIGQDPEVPAHDHEVSTKRGSMSHPGGAQWGGSVSDFVFGFSADPGHDLLEIIRKSRVASQARVDAARQVGDTVGPTEAEHGSQFMQRDLAVLAAEPGGGRSSDVRIAATRQSRTDQAEVITNRLEDGLRISCGQLTSTRKRWIRQDRPGQLPQPSDEPLRAQHPATEGRAERRGRRTPQTCLHEAPVGTR